MYTGFLFYLVFLESYSQSFKNTSSKRNLFITPFVFSLILSGNFDKKSDMTSSSQKTRLRDEYLSRVNRVLDYIETHVDQPLSLNELASVARFSPFHFHRIFRSLVGESLNQFILRVRLEKAVTLLANTPSRTITEISLDCGFSGSASFARAFKEWFGLSATLWRKNNEKSKNCKLNRKKCKTKSKEGKAFEPLRLYDGGINKISTPSDRRKKQMNHVKAVKVEVKELPEMPVAYVRHIGPYKGDERLFKSLFGKLFKWAGPRGLIHSGALVLCVYHDDPAVTDEQKLRVSVCITVPADTKVEGGIGKMVLPAGKYAMGRFELSSEEYGGAWDFMCGQWLPESGYQPDDKLCFEICRNDPEEHPQKKHIVDICIPVKPL